jgi:RNA polymerase sigma-70 factor (ECF subfamily)
MRAADPMANSDQPEEFIPTRRSLLTRLKRWDDRESWQDFFDTYWKLIYTVAKRAGLEEEDAQDVVQDTVISVARQMPNFKYDPAIGSFKNWLSLITRRRITDHLRKQYRRFKPADPSPQRKTASTTLLERIPDPSAESLDAVWEEEWEKQLFAAAVQKAKREIEPKHFQIFDCYVLKEWPVKDIVRTFAVSANQVYLIKHRVAELIAKEVRKLKAAEAPSS